MKFQLLGPVRIWRDDTALPIGPAKQRSLLTALLLEPNRIVPLDRLVAMLWDGDPPRSAVANVRTYASRLRRLLVDATGAVRLSGHGPGYRLAVGDDELDVTAFRRLTADGRAALAAGQPARAVQLLGRAVSLWKGGPGEDLERSAGLDRCLGPLQEQRLTTIEDWIDAKQRLGQGIGVVSDLRRLLDEHPLRERLWSQLVLALYRTGDVAAALSAFAEARRCFADRLGVDLGPQMIRLHRAMLRRDPALDGAAVMESVPRELPADAMLLVGRDREQATMAEAVLRSDGPVFIALDGPAGIGKSALAVRVATRLGRHFPDGQLYVDLHGSDPARPVRRPVDVLGQCLRSLGVPAGQIPDSEEEAAARYRTIAANRRLLVVLEDAAASSQVRPLLTATAGSAVIITSRARLAVHDRTVHIGLGPLTVADSVEILAGLGGGSPDSGPRLLQLARSCDGSPLALRRAVLG
ncbi:BTAD domain-containing putative transcriptional regulator [Dactylosporangium sp. CS-033363]|uniref:AfsR/SARP family transcriptional regulator n=1 Tax=Dactylosporangium sp. CS-033363 TaxID=3239935 RepID=UPI003D8E097F